MFSLLSVSIYIHTAWTINIPNYSEMFLGHLVHLVLCESTLSFYLIFNVNKSKSIGKDWEIGILARN